MRRIVEMSLRNKFLIGIGLIVAFFWAFFSYLIYAYLKNIYVTETFSKTNMLFHHIQSTMEFVREDLRPKMFHVLQQDQFIKEAMSSSFITRDIMDRFKRVYPDIVYRRVSLHPMNPYNLANQRERKFIGMFQEDRNKRFWKGVLTVQERQYAVHVKPVIMRKECLACHGRPEDAPYALRVSYPSNQGFFRKVGSVIGIELISIPLDKTFRQIRKLAVSIFLAGIIGMMMMFLSLNSLIHLVAVRPLKRISLFFKLVVDGSESMEKRLVVRSRDEIGELAASFNRMMNYLKRSQEQLGRSEKKYRQIFEGSKDAIIVFNCDGSIQEINPAGMELLECDTLRPAPEELTLQDLFIRDEDFSLFMRQMESDGFLKDFETRLRTRSGNLKDVLMSVNYRMDEPPKICGYEALIKDITERKRLVEQIHEAERMAAVGRLAAGVAHEINNPLSIIIGYSGLLLEDPSTGESIRKDLNTISQNAYSCKKIVEDLLNFSRKSPPEFDYHDINRILGNVLNMLGYEFEKRRIQVTCRPSDSFPLLYIDAEKIKQVMMNILLNACQSIGEEGHIEISRLVDHDRGTACFMIADDGDGIPEEIRSKIFQPFFTTKAINEGTGLGLSVSYGIMQEHGGRIYAENRLPHGAVFILEFPCPETGKIKREEE